MAGHIGGVSPHQVLPTLTELIKTFKYVLGTLKPVQGPLRPRLLHQLILICLCANPVSDEFQSCGINPLTTEFFPPRQHIFMHSAHTTFVGTPLPQHSLLSGQTWWGPHTWRDPSGNTVNDIHDPPQGQQSEVKGGCQPDFRPAFP